MDYWTDLWPKICPQNWDFVCQGCKIIVAGCHNNIIGGSLEDNCVG